MSVEIASGRSPIGKRAGLDHELSAVRRLKASAEKYYDPEIDIDWDAPLVPGAHWLSEHRTSLSGTGLWKGLTAEQRVEFGRQQFGTMMIIGLWFESGLGVYLYHDLVVSPVESSRTRYLLTQIGEETRHSTMFSRLVEKMSEAGSPITYRIPGGLKGAVLTLLSMFPVGAAPYAFILMAEEVLDRLQREGMNDPAVQPHARTAMRIHVIEEARHEAFAKEEIVRGYQNGGRFGRFVIRVVAGFTALLFATMGLTNPQMYRAVGISPTRGILTALFSKQYRTNAQFLLGPISRFFYDVGIIRGFTAKLLWRFSRGLADDVKVAMKDGSERQSATAQVAPVRSRTL
ncbi:hypothetical protein BKG80_00020 [Mycobacteroides chelonae]|uniref:AurF N-oxygenase family protein n=1 Tax=Mycobacteroides chelonae TaxID=1774 RepID=UPI0008A9C9CC|nr:diiron oxygenase [Mycobacteroides chelonae]OHU44765.1 hypothetical protein BKG80_00020 [Mycobacteroides chelonae]